MASRGGAQPPPNRVEAALADARTARRGIVNEDRGLAGIDVVERGEPSQIPAIAGGDEARRPMAACSAACRVPGLSSSVTPAPKR